MRSRRTRSGRPASNASRASAPSEAVSTANPSFSRYRASTSRTIGSSSTTSTRDALTAPFSPPYVAKSLPASDVGGSSGGRYLRLQRRVPCWRMSLARNPSSRPGPLALVGGDELNPGNEPQDEVLVAAASGGPAYVLATAAGRQRPDLAVRNARAWFKGLGLDVEELPAIRRSDVTSPKNAELARGGRFFYLVGGDPGLVPKTLADTPVWDAIVEAWREGAVLAGSSAGATALGGTISSLWPSTSARPRCGGTVCGRPSGRAASRSSRAPIGVGSPLASGSTGSPSRSCSPPRRWLPGGMIARGGCRSRKEIGMAGPTGVDDYLAALPEDQRAALQKLRKTICVAATEATETISYQMPTFKLRGRVLVYYAAFKDHCSLFPASEAVMGALGEELKPYFSGKGTLRFTPDKPIPAALLKKIVKARIE